MEHRYVSIIFNHELKLGSIWSSPTVRKIKEQDQGFQHQHQSPWDYLGLWDLVGVETKGLGPGLDNCIDDVFKCKDTDIQELCVCM